MVRSKLMCFDGYKYQELVFLFGPYKFTVFVRDDDDDAHFALLLKVSCWPARGQAKMRTKLIRLFWIFLVGCISVNFVHFLSRPETGRLAVQECRSITPYHPPLSDGETGIRYMQTCNC